MRSTRDAAAYLARRGVAAADAARAVRAARRQGLLDDRAAARLWAGHWARQGFAVAAIRAKLAAKGFAEGAAADAVRASVTDSDETRAQAMLAASVAPARRRSPPDAARLARRLAARGFDPDIIARLLPDCAAHAER